MASAIVSHPLRAEGSLSGALANLSLSRRLTPTNSQTWGRSPASSHYVDITPRLSTQRRRPHTTPMEESWSEVPDCIKHMASPPSVKTHIPKSVPKTHLQSSTPTRSSRSALRRTQKSPYEPKQVRFEDNGDRAPRKPLKRERAFILYSQPKPQHDRDVEGLRGVVEKLAI